VFGHYLQILLSWLPAGLCSCRDRSSSIRSGGSAPADLPTRWLASSFAAPCLAVAPVHMLKPPDANSSKGHCHRGVERDWARDGDAVWPLGSGDPGGGP